MVTINVKPKNNENVDKKPRVWFTCHPDDFDACFEIISRDIFKTHDCAIYYTEDMTETIAEDEKETDLGRSNLFVVPITEKLLTTPNRAMDEDIPYALEKHIPVLPIRMEAVDNELYSARFGELQYLNPLSNDPTEIPYEEKLKKYLESVLISKELADRIRHAFYAYIFLSYRKVDRAYANTLMRLIHSIPDCRDFAIWFDEFLTPGESFKVNIEKALNDCKLFTLLVTKQLFKKRLDENGKEVDNFVIANELPIAKDKRTEKGTKIFAVEMEHTGENAPLRLEADEYIRYDDAAFRERLLATIKKIKYDVVDTPEHAFLIGLAYLEGIDMEVDRERAVELIETAAEEDLAEAMEKLIRMHKDGVGVSRDVESVQKWSKRLADHYFRRIISKKGTVKSKKKLLELFSHYADEYFAETLKAFLMYVDDRLTEDVITQLYDLLMNQGICEYTLFFEACKGMQKHREKAQCSLLRDILQKSVDGTYPPYGPLFWYVPEYELYEPLLLTLNNMTNKQCYAKALALTRDVCWIFGRYNSAAEITNRVTGAALFVNADICGVRRSLCELFFTGNTAETCDNDIYPRCFNIAEAKSWKKQGQGILGRMLTAFDDELGLYSHKMFSEIGGEYIGIVAAPYDKERLEAVLPQKSCKKLCGLFLSPTENAKFVELAINNKHLDRVYVPENVTKIDTQRYQVGVLHIPDKGLLYYHTIICIPDGVTKIENDSFKCSNIITSIKIPNSVTTIGDSAFERCHALKSINLPDDVLQIGENAFKECDNLESITIPNGVTKIGQAAFKNCTNLKDIIIPAGLTEIEDSLFEGCCALMSINIPSSIVCIGNCAFKGCNILESVNIPNSVMSIGHSAFEGCCSFTTVAIPDDIVVIRQSTFCNCCNLKSVTLPNGLIEIEWYAFSYCKSLISITIPYIVMEIGECAFKDCNTLASVTFLNNTNIEDNAFEGCSSLKQIVNCPMGYAAKYKKAAEECLDIATTTNHDELFVIPPGTIEIIEDTIPSQKRRIIKAVIFPDSVTTIGWNAFLDCYNLTTITIPNSVTEIGWHAFENAVALTSINIPDGVRVISYSVFKKCRSLISLNLPCHLTKIECSAFADCCAIEGITIPTTVNEIEPCAFSGCSALKSINIPAGVKAVEDLVFYGCRSLSAIEIPTSVETIGELAFYGCKSLVSMFIPDGVTKIEKCAFEECDGLESILIPVSVKEINNSAFAGCTGLREITISRRFEDDLPSIFSGVDLSQVTIHWI